MLNQKSNINVTFTVFRSLNTAVHATVCHIDKFMLHYHYVT